MDRVTIPPAKNPAKAFLNRYRGALAKCRALQQAIDAAQEDATNITVTLKAVNIQSTGSGERMADNVVKKLDAAAMLIDARADADKILKEIMTAILSVPDDVQQTVLIEKYVNGKKLDEIRGLIGYEQRNTVIIHGRALWSVWQWMKKQDGGLNGI